MNRLTPVHDPENVREVLGYREHMTATGRSPRTTHVYDTGMRKVAEVRHGNVYLANGKNLGRVSVSDALKQL